MAITTTGVTEEVAAYVDGLARQPSPVLAEIAAHVRDTGGEQIQISPAQGALLSLLVRAIRARRILEIGTYLGYSSIWLASAAGPGARVDTYEIDPERAAQARAFIARADTGCAVEVHLGNAAELLATAAADGYDLAFIDANKVDYPRYLDIARRLVRPGGLIVADNTLHKGRVLVPEPERPTSRAIREYNTAVFAHEDLTSVLVPLGDGMTVSVVG